MQNDEGNDPGKGRIVSFPFGTKIHIDNAIRLEYNTLENKINAAAVRCRKTGAVRVGSDSTIHESFHPATKLLYYTLSILASKINH